MTKIVTIQREHNLRRTTMEYRLLFTTPYDSSKRSILRTVVFSMSIQTFSTTVEL